MAQEEALDGKALDQAMDDDIRATLKDITSREAPIDKVDDTVVAASEEVAKTNERARDPEGKFTKQAKESAAPEKADTQTPAVASASDQAAAGITEPVQPQGAAQAIDLNRAPSSWKPAAKAAWTALPEPVRAEIYRREGDFHNGVKGFKENADFGQAIKTTLEPYRVLIEAEGGTPERAIADTMRTAALFRTGTAQAKLDAIFSIDKQFNVGLGNYIQTEFNRLYAEQTGTAAKPAAQQQPFRDDRVDQILAAQKRQDDERSQRDNATVSTAIQKFVDAKNDKNEPLHPFVDNVLDDMSNRLAAIRRNNPAVSPEEALKRAYDESVWANTDTRAVLLAQQQAQASAPTENQKRVEQAKRASAVNVPKRGALPATGPAKSLDETIRETAQALGMF